MTNSQEIEIVRWFGVEYKTGEQPIFMNTIESNVQEFLKLIDSSDEPSSYVSFAHSEFEKFEAAFGYDYDQNWRLEVWVDGKIYTPAFHASCRSRATLEDVARVVSLKLLDADVRIQRWARIRKIYRGGTCIKDFSEVPYTNVADSDWL